ncbi:MAG: hypothetical protein D6753_07560 [Planctomycetota bacterium]|nr:MAG: hypothetical protein D6753_07560 [Planctomycetota bacterium]
MLVAPLHAGQLAEQFGQLLDVTLRPPQIALRPSMDPPQQSVCGIEQAAIVAAHGTSSHPVARIALLGRRRYGAPPDPYANGNSQYSSHHGSRLPFAWYPASSLEPAALSAKRSFAPGPWARSPKIASASHSGCRYRA